MGDVMSGAIAGRLAGKVAIVTGAGSGIGRATAIKFAAEGARVAMLSRTAETGVEAANEAVASARHGGDAVSIRTDVTQSDQVASAFRQVADRWGGLDISFNAAGIS